MFGSYRLCIGVWILVLHISFPTNYLLELFPERDHNTAEIYTTKIKGHAFDDLDWIYLMA
jgi:hypothetical protein